MDAALHVQLPGAPVLVCTTLVVPGLGLLAERGSIVIKSTRQCSKFSRAGGHAQGGGNAAAAEEGVTAHLHFSA